MNAQFRTLKYRIMILAGLAVFSVGATQHHQSKKSNVVKTKYQKIIVKTHLKKFTLTYNRKKVRIEGYMMNLSLNRKKCNSHIIDRFNQDIKKIIRKYKKDLKKEWKGKKNIATLKVHLRGRQYFLNGDSKAGMVFLAIPKEIIRMKKEEKLNCPTKKTVTQKNPLS